jgi:hypothetical protein
MFGNTFRLQVEKEQDVHQTFQILVVFAVNLENNQGGNKNVKIIKL